MEPEEKIIPPNVDPEEKKCRRIKRPTSPDRIWPTVQKKVGVCCIPRLQE